MEVARSMSFDAPVVTFSVPKTSSSATRPPSAGEYDPLLSQAGAARSTDTTVYDAGRARARSRYRFANAPVAATLETLNLINTLVTAPLPDREPGGPAPENAVRGLAYEEPLSIERSRAGRIGWSLPELDVPAVDPASVLPEGSVRTAIRRAKQQLERELERLAGSPAELQETLSSLDSWVRRIREHLDGRAS